jgi:MinD-like ATPase involved in chromosome partitioning or flagellar assembly
VNERGLVEVPENAVRDEPIAFGLTAIQLGICAVAVVVAAVFNLLPIWEPIRLVLVLIGAGPIALAAALPVRGDPAYRWIVRAVRHRRGPRCWNATPVGLDKPQLSGLDDTAETEVHPPMTEPPAAKTVEEREAQPELPAASPAGPRLHVVGSWRDVAPDPELPTVVPHLVGGLQIACLLSFAGGVGKTTLAVEMASLIGSRARYQTLDGEEKPVRVLLVDAARSNPACHLRLGVEGATVSRLLSRFEWPDAMTFAGRVVETRFGVSLLSLPQLPLQGLGPEVPFGPIEVDAILEAAESAGFQVVVVDLGTQLEEGHRHLIGQAKTVVGVVTPRGEALPDVLRITSYVRALGGGRKLALVANAASVEGHLPTLADEEQVAIVATIPRLDAFDTAGDRGIPAWTDAPEIERAILPLAASVWPLIGGIPRSSERRFRRSVLGAVRRLLHAEGERG